MAKIPRNLSDKDMFKGWQEEPTIEETFREKESGILGVCVEMI